MADLEMGWVDVDGCEIAWTARGERDRDAILLIHGAGAHSGWWEESLQFLPRDKRIVSLDLSGHGRSGHRDAYNSAIWTKEIDAVIAAATLGRVSIVGHSSGGRVGLIHAARRPTAVESLILVDVWVRHPETSGERSRTRSSRKVYSSRAAAVAAFRLMPPQPKNESAAARALAESSIVERDGRWSYRSDPEVLGSLPDTEVAAAMAAVQCPVAAIRGGLSTLMNDDAMAFLRTTLGQSVPLVTVPDAYHHVMLDAPSTTAQSITTLQNNLLKIRLSKQPSTNLSGVSAN